MTKKIKLTIILAVFVLGVIGIGNYISIPSVQGSILEKMHSINN